MRYIISAIWKKQLHYCNNDIIVSIMIFEMCHFKCSLRYKYMMIDERDSQEVMKHKTQNTKKSIQSIQIILSKNKKSSKN